MAFLCCCHGHHFMFNNMSTVFDFRNTQMILTIKLTSLGWNIYDYQRISRNSSESMKGDAVSNEVKDGNPNHTHSHTHTSRRQKVLADRTMYAVPTLPSLLEFLGYVYCFPCVMVGPALEFREYADGIAGPASQPLPPSSFLWPACFSLLQGLVFLPLHLLISGAFPITRVVAPDLLQKYNVLQQYGFLWCAVYGIRCRFYFAWKVSEAAAVFAGFGFEGFDSSGKAMGWRNAQNVDIIALETAPSLQALVRQWNKRTQSWLERYVYHRTGGSILATYVFSALWHGFYPGYLIFFLSVACLTLVERGLRSRLNRLVQNTRNPLLDSLYSVVGCVVTNVAFNYIVPLFFLLSVERSLQLLASYYFVPHIVFLTLALLLTIFPDHHKVASNQNNNKVKTA